VFHHQGRETFGVSSLFLFHSPILIRKAKFCLNLYPLGMDILVYHDQRKSKKSDKTYPPCLLPLTTLDFGKIRRRPPSPQQGFGWRGSTNNPFSSAGVADARVKLFGIREHIRVYAGNDITKAQLRTGGTKAFIDRVYYHHDLSSM